MDDILSFDVAGSTITVNVPLYETLRERLRTFKETKVRNRMSATELQDIINGKQTAKTAVSDNFGVSAGRVIRSKDRSTTPAIFHSPESSGKKRKMKDESVSSTSTSQDFNRKSRTVEKLRPEDRSSKDRHSPVVQDSNKKKKKTDERPASPKVTRCKLCKATRLRVASYDRSDGKNFLECASRNCLATVSLTTKPVGTMIGELPESEKNYGWYLRNPADVMYPSLELIRQYTKLAPTLEPEFLPPVLYDEDHNVIIRCPGQRNFVRLM